LTHKNRIYIYYTLHYNFIDIYFVVRLIFYDNLSKKTDIYGLDIYFCSMCCTQGRRTMLSFARLDLCQQVVARASSFVFRHFKANIDLLRIVSFAYCISVTYQFNDTTRAFAYHLITILI